MVAVLRKRYPITVEELREEMSIRRDTLNRTLKGLAVKGVLALEPLPDKIFVRLLMPGMDITGKPAQERDAESREGDSMAYR